MVTVGNILISDKVQEGKGDGENEIGFLRFSCFADSFLCIITLVRRQLRLLAM